MQRWKIPLFKIAHDEADVRAVAGVIRRGTYWTLGPEVERFEKALASSIGVGHAVTFNSGTSALHALLLAADVRGKEVIVPSFTFISTANVVLLAGGKPVFAESEQDTYGLDAKDVERKITAATRAIIPIHYGGFPSRDITQLRALADNHGLLLLDDAAESFGASLHGKKVGTFGHATMFSLCQNKVITTGDGGFVVTDSKEIYEKLKLIRSHGRVETSADYFSSIEDNDYIEVGYNYRMPSLLAALGLSQLRKLSAVRAARKSHAAYLTQNLSGIRELTLPREMPGHSSVYQMYTIRLPSRQMRDALQLHLRKKGIMTKVYFNPIHLKTLYARLYRYKKGDLPFTEDLSERVLTLPLYVTLTKKELAYIVASLTSFFKPQRGTHHA